MRQVSSLAVLSVLSLLGWIAVTYFPCVSGGFIWDDRESMIENPLITSSDGLYRLWFTTESPDYFPLAYSLLWVEYHLWGRDPKPYHVVNLFFHAIVCLLLWRVLVVLGVPGAWFSSLIFAIHPVNVESVAWIYQQRTTLPMIFFLCSILAFLRYDATGGRRWYAASLMAFVLGLLSKTSIVTLPGILLLLVWWKKGTLMKRNWVGIIPFVVVAAVFAVVTAWFQANRAIGTDVVRTDTFLERLAGAGYAVWFYLGKAVFPVRLSFVYPRWQIDVHSISVYLPIVLLVLCFAILYRYRRTWGRAPFVATGYFVLTLLPVLGFFNIYFMRFSLVADHWQYVSLPGIIALVAGTLRYIARFRMATITGAIAAALLAGLTYMQAGLYKSEDTIWRDTIAKNPTAWLAHYNLGLSYVSRGLYDLAEKRFLDTVKHNPDYAEAYNNLGLLYQNQGKIGMAMVYYKEAIRLKPQLAEAHSNLANALATVGKFEEALKEHAAAIALDSHNAVIRNDYAATLLQVGKVDDAIQQCESALRIDPDNPDALLNLAVGLFYKGKYREAWAKLSRARELGASPKPEFLRALLSKMLE